MVNACLGVVLLSIVSAAAAADHPHEARKLALKERNARQSLSWSVRLPPPAAPAASPLVVGATLEVRAESGEGASFDLPASGWTADGSGTTFKYKNRDAPSGPSPVKAVTLKAQRAIKVTGKGTGVTLDEAAQGTVVVALVVGGDAYCSACTAPRRDEPGRYLASRCPAPPSCAVTTTTTTSSTTTSTFVAGVCGNDVVDPPSEECDGTEASACSDTIPLGLPLQCSAADALSPCRCCHPAQCVHSIQFGSVGCCGSSQCQLHRGVFAVQPGTCIPPSCSTDADCNGYRCVGGSCCGDAGQGCDLTGCCPGSGTTCEPVPFATVTVCCRQAGGSCDTSEDCCSGSCTSGVCD
jgi:hypothetical protein